MLGDRVLSRLGNDTGSDVADLVTLLIAVGNALPPGNVFDAAVEAAVIAFQTGHGLTADGVVRLDTVRALRQALTQSSTDDDDTHEVMDDVPAPVVQPPATRRKFRFGQANLEAQRFGGLLNISDDRGEFLRDEMKCSVYALCEVTEAARDAIRAVLGADRYKVWTVGYVCVMWDSTKWQHAGKQTVGFGNDIHGAVRVTLEDVEGSGLSMDVISIHVRPGAAIGGSDAHILATKKSDIRKAMTALVRPGVPTMIAGDFNTPKAADVIEPFGFTRLTKAIDTLNEPGDQRLDATFVTPGLKLRSQKLIDPGDVSDHKVWLLKNTLTQSNN